MKKKTMKKLVNSYQRLVGLGAQPKKRFIGMNRVLRVQRYAQHHVDIRNYGGCMTNDPLNVERIFQHMRLGNLMDLEWSIMDLWDDGYPVIRDDGTVIVARDRLGEIGIETLNGV